MLTLNTLGRYGCDDVSDKWPVLMTALAKYEMGIDNAGWVPAPNPERRLAKNESAKFLWEPL